MNIKVGQEFFKYRGSDCRGKVVITAVNLPNDINDRLCCMACDGGLYYQDGSHFEVGNKDFELKSRLD